MGDRSSIEWTDATWNPIRGCSRVSPGCEHCYAETWAGRFADKPAWRGLARRGPFGARWTGEVRLVPEHLQDPLRWQRPRRIFVNSMSDLFHESLPTEVIGLVFAVMAKAQHHTFQVLTKRAQRMRDWVTAQARVWPSVAVEQGVPGWPLPNVWLGVSVEDQERADERIPLLLDTAAAVRFVSAEPLLGKIETENLPVPRSSAWHGWTGTYNALTGRFGLAVGDPDEEMRHAREQVCDETRIDWVICGAESGAGARPMREDWARSLRDQCQAAGVPFFLKQFATTKGRKLHLPLLDGRQHVAWPEARS